MNNKEHFNRNKRNIKLLTNYPYQTPMILINSNMDTPIHNSKNSKIKNY